MSAKTKATTHRHRWVKPWENYRRCKCGVKQWFWACRGDWQTQIPGDMKTIVGNDYSVFNMAAGNLPLGGSRVGKTMFEALALLRKELREQNGEIRRLRRNQPPARGRR